MKQVKKAHILTGMSTMFTTITQLEEKSEFSNQRLIICRALLLLEKGIGGQFNMNLLVIIEII